MHKFQVDKWLLELEEQMRCSLRKETSRALENYDMEKSEISTN